MLKKLRTKKGYSQKILADRIGITQGYLSRLENRKIKNKGAVSVELIEKLAHELNPCHIKLFIYFSNKSIDPNCKCCCCKNIISKNSSHKEDI